MTLHNIPCRAPCWEGIIPGQTPFDAAVAILKSKPFIATLVFTPTKTRANTDFFGWDYVNEQGRGIAEYETLSPEHTILSFSAGLPGATPLREIMSAYGEPTHVLALARLEGAENRPGYSLDLIYLNDGFLIATEVPSVQMQLTEEMPMVGLSFFAPRREALQAIFPFKPGHWDGEQPQVEPGEYWRQRSDKDEEWQCQRSRRD